MSDVHDQWFSHAFGLDIVRAAEAISTNEFVSHVRAGAAPVPTNPPTGGVDGGLFGGGYGGPGNSPMGGDDGAFIAGGAGTP